MLKDGEVELTQYLRPHGIPRKVIATIDSKHADLAKSYSLACEDLGNGMIAIYGRLPYETEETELTEIAENGPGNNTPNDALIRLIDRLVSRDKIR